MRITLVTYGTRGDVQPVLALGFALQQRGHQTNIVGPLNARSTVEAAGVPFHALPVDIAALLVKPAAQQMLANGNISTFFKWLAAEELAYAAPMRQAVIDGCKGAEAIVAHTLMEDRAAAVAAARKVPLLPLHAFPVPPSSRFASPFITTRNLGPLNRITHKLVMDMLWKSSADDVNLMRKQLDIAPAHETYTLSGHRAGAPCVLGYSEALFPRPRDYAMHDVITGSIVPPDALLERLGERGLPEDLSAWLDRGDPPVFLGFGSMPVLDVQAMLDKARTMLRATGRRGVIGAGWSDLPRGGDDQLFAIGSVDHTALFPRCVAAVHHGGSGTTYASLRAGLPTLICSVFADQPFWGTRVRALGVGATLPFAKLSTKTLTQGVRTLLEPEVQARARALGARLRQEDGLARVIELIERDLPNAPIPH